jgi:hypothetical protein
MQKYFLIAVTCLIIFSNQAYSQQYAPLKKVIKNYFVMPNGITDEDYLAKTIIFKVKSGYRNQCENEKIDIQALQDIFEQLEIKKLAKKFPRHTPPENPYHTLGKELTDLSLIYQLNYTSNIHIEDAINMLYQTDVLEYACMHVVPKALYTPDDPNISSEYHLTNIKAYDAWDIEKGDTNMVISIIDTGFELTHEDMGNIKYNYADPIDGQDNDNDGYTDNYKGWDMAMGDNNPAYVTYNHGTGVAGIASASTDNAKGVAGVGFKCKYLPIKTYDDLGYLFVNSYEAIVYSADHDCKVINCSWGGTFAPGQYAQDVIDYATFNKDAMVVAAAGNDGDEGVFYPASLNYVLSVAGTDQSDVKWIGNGGVGGSNYGPNIDIAAPAKQIYFPSFGSYTIGSGTSEACPMVCGAAALVRSHYPDLSALQVMQRLKISADNIDTLSGNAAYVGKLGAGRLNMYKALTDSTSPGIALWSKTLTDNNDENYYSNDTISITGEFINYLESTSALSIALSSANANVNIISDSVYIGAVSNLQLANNNSNPFKVVVLSSASDNESIELKLTYTDGSYSAFEYITFNVNQSYLNIVPNEISTTLTGIGRIGFNGELATEGMSLSYKDYAMLYASSFMIGNSSTSVSDGIYSETVAIDGTYDNDFENMESIMEEIPASYADNDYHTKFNDSNATSILGVEVTQNVYAWNESGYDKFIIFEYDIKNNNSSTLSNLYAGIFTDWDIFYGTANAAHIDTTYKIGYAKSLTHNMFAGVHLIEGGDFVSYAIDMNEENGSIGYYVDGGISASDKFTALSTMRDSAGYTGSAYGEDVANCVSNGPFTLGTGQTTRMAFAIMVGNSLSELQSIADAADEKYELMYSPVASILGQADNPCKNLCLGQALVGVTAGGGLPFSYQWNDADSQATALATDLCAGTYSVVVGDANGNFDTLSVTITEPDSLLASIQVSNASSSTACDGAATITPSGGTPPYTYLWGDSLAQTDSIATGLCAMGYLVLTTDSNGCQRLDTAWVSFLNSIKENTNGRLLNCYPIPASDKFILEMDIEKQGPYELSLYNAVGEKILKIFNSNLNPQHYKFNIDISKLPEGTYFIQLTGSDMIQAKTITISR